MRISDWSSDVCSSDLHGEAGKPAPLPIGFERIGDGTAELVVRGAGRDFGVGTRLDVGVDAKGGGRLLAERPRHVRQHPRFLDRFQRSEEHTSELPSLMCTSYAVSCLKKKKHGTT